MVCAKIIALRTIYEKKESCRQEFLERISYTPREMTAVMNKVCDDTNFCNWIEAAIPMMHVVEDI